MNLLLDTCTFLWILSDKDKIPLTIQHLVTSPENSIYLSVISNWEIAIKQQIGRLKLPSPPDYIKKQREAHDIESLVLTETCIQYLAKLPHIHTDPFDRMLICQAMDMSMTILTPDTAISSYPIKTLWE